MYLIYLALHYSELKESFNALPRNLQLAYITELNSCFDDLGEAFASRDKGDFENAMQLLILEASKCPAIPRSVIIIKKLVEL